MTTDVHKVAGANVDKYDRSGDALYTMDDARQSQTRIADFTRWVRKELGLNLHTYAHLHAWSTQDLSGFWTAVTQFFDVHLGGGSGTVLDGSEMPDVRWFPGATVNYAEYALRYQGPGDAIVGISQARERERLTRDELRAAVSACRAGLADLGVGVGDRVAGYLPNVTEAVIAFLATASLGAIWSVCSPEIGVSGAVARFAQIQPKVLIGVDGYVFGTKIIDRRAELQRVAAQLSSAQVVVLVPLIGGHNPPSGWLAWATLLNRRSTDLEFEQVAFDHELVVVFSSGTTGPPKPIVHGHGGILLEHLKWLGLHFDLRPDDRFLWHTSTSWIMWNVAVSALLLGSTTVLFDGDPTHPDAGHLWDLAGSEEITCLGMGATLLAGGEQAGVELDRQKLHRLRTVGSTGSPLPVHSYYWIYRWLPDVLLSSVSGGTDVASAFLGGSPLLPVFAGEISASCLGVDAVGVDGDGHPVIGERGELVIRRPMPSMPVGIYGDQDGTRLRESYFAVFPGQWRHGDWVRQTDRGSWVVEGRSDATLNRGGVRLGTGEYYSFLNQDSQIADSLVVFLDGEDGDPGKLLVFLKTAPGVRPDGQIEIEIRDQIRRELSPRHVPDEVYVVNDIPLTHSGKRMEVPIKRLLSGLPLDVAVPIDAIANPACLEEYDHIRHRRSGNGTSDLRRTLQSEYNGRNHDPGSDLLVKGYDDVRFSKTERGSTA